MRSLEEWRPVVGYEGLYEVSSHGRVRRVDATARGPAGRLLKLRLNQGGYPIVFLSRKSKQKLFRVHRLVAFAFLGNPGKGFEVCHADDVKHNNHVSNLRWDTHRNNMREMVKNGAPHLAKQDVCRKGVHALTPETTVKNGGGKRVCRECRNEYQRMRELRKQLLEVDA